LLFNAIWAIFSYIVARTSDDDARFVLDQHA
jgi:hypothetical protein